MKMRLNRSLLPAVGVLGLGLAACGSDDSGTGIGGAGGTTTSAGGAGGATTSTGGAGGTTTTGGPAGSMATSGSAGGNGCWTCGDILEHCLKPEMAEPACPDDVAQASNYCTQAGANAFTAFAGCVCGNACSTECAFSCTLAGKDTMCVECWSKNCSVQANNCASN